MTVPGGLKPLWIAHAATSACCKAWERSGLSPSMVVIARPSACAKVIWHEGKACPSTITKQAPHSPVPQPYFVPVRLAPQRRAQSKGVSASMRRSTGWPLSVKADMNAPCPPAPVTSSQSALLQTKPQAGPDRARHANIHAARLIAGDDRACTKAPIVVAAGIR
ncbi:hypothetical protein E4T56_gene17808 [Termitomyces sp. T112]|nr:hypothetical protein E4T56_gene17808 [Termitomyces sp. T112]